MNVSGEMECYETEYRKTRLFSPLVLDYIEKPNELKHYFDKLPALDSFTSQIESKSKSQIDRKTLVDTLIKQYERTGINDENAFNNIRLLLDENTFTVATGQQIVVFTGPLYFPFKIASTINLARQLKRKFPERSFVPVFWMATEDHDFDEINHVYVKGQKLVWNAEAKGPVGRLKTNGIEELIQKTEQLTGKSDWTELLYKAYTHSSLADATRYLVHSLYGNEGLVVVDGDDIELKRLFAPIIHQDITNEISFKEVSRQNEYLSQTYKVQVNPREINFFYQTNEYRSRIIKTGESWHTENQSKSWSASELKNDVFENSDAFSPNVLMRPLYQEAILPNLAYIGGGAEVAYWLQLKSTFDAFKLPYPILLLRNHAVFLNRVQHYQLKNSGVDIETLFQPLNEALKQYALKNSEYDLSLNTEHQLLDKLISKLYVEAEKISGSLPKSVTAKGVQMHRIVEQLSTKFIRAQKKKSVEFNNRMENLHSAVFPNGKLQERHDNITLLFEDVKITNLIHSICSDFNPLESKFKVYAV